MLPHPLVTCRVLLGPMLQQYRSRRVLLLQNLSALLIDPIVSLTAFYVPDGALEFVIDGCIYHTPAASRLRYLIMLAFVLQHCLVILSVCNDDFQLLQSTSTTPEKSRLECGRFLLLWFNDKNCCMYWNERTCYKWPCYWQRCTLCCTMYSCLFRFNLNIHRDLVSFLPSGSRISSQVIFCL